MDIMDSGCSGHGVWDVLGKFCCKKNMRKPLFLFLFFCPSEDPEISWNFQVYLKRHDTTGFIDPKAVAWIEKNTSAITRLFTRVILSQFSSLLFFALGFFHFLCFLFGLTVLGGILTVLFQGSLPALWIPTVLQNGWKRTPLIFEKDGLYMFIPIFLRETIDWRDGLYLYF